MGALLPYYLFQEIRWACAGYYKPALLLYWFFTVSAVTSNAQHKVTDSLHHELTIATRDTSRILILSELSLQYRLSKPDSAMWYGQKALSLARQIDYSKGEANALGSIGFVMREVGNLPNALKVEFKAIQLAEEHRQPYEVARCQNIIGNIYMDLKDFPLALSYYHKARRKHEEIRNKSGVAITESNIGSVYEQLNKLDSAWYYEQKAYRQMRQLKLINNLPFVLRILGNIQAKRGNTALAMNYYQASSKLAFQENNLRNIAFANTAIAKLYQRKNQLDSCIYYARKSLSESQKGSYRRGVLMASDLLARVYESSDIGESLRYYKLAAETKDSLYGAEKLQALQSISFDEAERQRDLEMAQLAYQQQIRQNIFLISAIILVLIALLLWRTNLQKQKANALLFQQKTKIGQQSEQLKLMMRELHHRVKNNFAIVASLLKLQSVRLQDEKAIQAMKAGQQRVEAMSLIHQRLYQGERVTSVNMDEYLTDLATGLMQAYGYNSINFDLYFYIEQRTLDVDIAMPLGLIANELITNAFKHAYCDAERPMLRIALLRRDGVTLEVQDNGSGIDAETWRKINNRQSFGKQLIMSLSDQLEANIEVISLNGMLFRVRIPTNPKGNVASAVSKPSLRMT